MTDRIVDARGMKCPWPILRLTRAMGEAETVVLLADDPLAAGEVAALAEARGWRVEREGERFTVSSAPPPPR